MVLVVLFLIIVVVSSYKFVVRVAESSAHATRVHRLQPSQVKTIVRMTSGAIPLGHVGLVVYLICQPILDVRVQIVPRATVKSRISSKSMQFQPYPRSQP